MASSAFARARRFLHYNRFTAWGAIALAVTLGVLYVALIAVFGLFADLAVSEGEISVGTAVDEAQIVNWLGDVIGDPAKAKELLQQRHGDGLGLISFAWRSRGAWYEGLLNGPVAWFEWTRSNTSFLIGLMITALVLAVLRGATTYGMRSLASKASVEAATRLRRAVYHHTYRLGTLAFKALGPAEAVGVFTRNLEAVHEGLYIWLTGLFRDPTLVGLLLIFAALIDPWLALAFLLLALHLWVGGASLAAAFRRREKGNTRLAAEQLALLQESIKMMRLVKCYGMELFNQARVERQLATYERSLLRRYRGEAVYRPALVTLILSAVIVLAAIGGAVVLAGHLTVAGLLTLALVLVGLYAPTVRCLEYRGTLQRARQGAFGLFRFLDRRADVAQIVGAAFLPPLGQSLEFDNVTLREPGSGKPLLRGISLRVDRGQRIAVVGAEEMEKHALVYLIPRFLDPESGEIRIDGKDLRWVTLDSLRAQVAPVLQHNLVFNDTVANNIGCGDPHFMLPQIIDAAKIAHAHQFIQRLPHGYETRIGELGHALGLGEQFRIALARAILREPALVIIEEPPVPLDDDTKALIDDTLSRFLAGRTTIFLPHRLSTIRSCSTIFLLHHGRIEASGDHRDLVTQNELYRHLQYLEFSAPVAQG